MPRFFRKKWAKWFGITVLAAILFLWFTQIDVSPLPESITTQCDDAAGQKEQYCHGYRLLYGASLALEGVLEGLSTTLTLLGTIAVAVFTALLVWSTRQLGRISSGQGEHFRVTERAYVQISHTHPGIRFGGDDGHYWLKLKITNNGNTPAEVIDVHFVGTVVPKSNLLPAKPQYRRSEGNKLPVRAFLVKRGHFFYERPDPHSVSAEQLSQIRQGWLDLHIIGYVDYRDRFGEIHRAGYARTYQPHIDVQSPSQSKADFDRRNNLTFMIQEGYNYDRPRRPGEGWDERQS